MQERAATREAATVGVEESVRLAARAAEHAERLRQAARQERDEIKRKNAPETVNQKVRARLTHPPFLNIPGRPLLLGQVMSGQEVFKGRGGSIVPLLRNSRRLLLVEAHLRPLLLNTFRPFQPTRTGEAQARCGPGVTRQELCGGGETRGAKPGRLLGLRLTDGLIDPPARSRDSAGPRRAYLGYLV